MLDVVKDLKKELMNYCVAHAEMSEADDNRRSIRSTPMILRYTEAEAKFQKARRALKAKLPEGVLLVDVLVEFSSMLKEAYDDTSDHD